MSVVPHHAKVFRKPAFIGADIKNVVYPQVLKQIEEMPLFGEPICRGMSGTLRPALSAA
jgi:hypothetical protein